jgi:hypothetical protein
MTGPLWTAIRERDVAEQRVATLLQELWPVGSPIRWARGFAPTHWQSGHVVSHGSGDRIKVKNEQTQREYWIHAHDIMER